MLLGGLTGRMPVPRAPSVGKRDFRGQRIMVRGVVIAFVRVDDFRCQDLGFRPDEDVVDLFSVHSPVELMGGSHIFCIGIGGTERVEERDWGVGSVPAEDADGEAVFRRVEVAGDDDGGRFR